MSIQTNVFGKTKNGQTVHSYTITNQSGSSITLLDFGAIIRNLFIPDKDGILADVTLGFDSVAEYESDQTYQGATIGRFAGRIGKGQISIDGNSIQLATNLPPHHIHGGPNGLGKRVWDAMLSEDENRILFSIHSPDGEENFPGNFDAAVSFTWTEDNQLHLNYKVSTDEDTIQNMTNHVYLQLQGESAGDVGNHIVQIDADSILDIDKDSIPTGGFIELINKPMDLRKPTILSTVWDNRENTCMQYGDGLDFTYVLNSPSLDHSSAKVVEPNSKRSVTVYTTEPGLQFYTGQHMKNGLTGKNGIHYPRRGGLCLETQHFPDAPNHPNFPSTLLKKGKTYFSSTIFVFSIEK